MIEKLWSMKILKLFFFESDKLRKMRMCIKGYKDFKNDKYGEFE